MAVSNHDREHFARLGAIKRDTHRSAARQHLAAPLSERLAQSWALFEAFESTANAPRNESEAVAFYDRARSLGLIRG